MIDMAVSGKSANALPVVYICSRYRGDPEGNTEKARRYCRFAVDHCFIPIAPHLLLPQFMKEPEERKLAMVMDLVLLRKCEELWVFGEASEGMKQEIAYASKLKMKIRYFKEEDSYV